MKQYMKHIGIAVATLGIALSLVGCPPQPEGPERPPTAEFEVDVAYGLTGLTVDFDDESDRGNPWATVYAWQFGDGATSDARNPVHTYDTPGIYSVTLTLANTLGQDTLTKVDLIEVRDPIVPDASFESSVVTGPVDLEVAFTDTTIDVSKGSEGEGEGEGVNDDDPFSENVITSWAWDFGDGATSTEANPTHTYTVPGVYTVSLTITTIHGESSTESTDLIYAFADNLAYGGTSPDTGLAVIPRDDGGYFLAGETKSEGAGGSGIKLIRIDDRGQVQWEETYGSAADETFAGALLLSDGGFFLVGSTMTEEDGWDILLIRTDSSGVVLWDETYGGEEDDEATHAILTNDSAVAITGHVDTADTNGIDMFLMKVDGNGNVLWQETYGDTAYDLANHVSELDGGDYLICGSAGFVTKGGSSGEGVLIRTNSDGEQTWRRLYGGDGDDVFNAVLPLSTGFFACVGTSASFGAGDLDGYLVVTEEDGDVESDMSFGDTAEDVFYDVVELEEDVVAITGSTGSYGAALLDALVMVYNLDSAEGMYSLAGGEAADRGFAMAIDVDENIVVTGSTESFGAGSLDFYLFKVDPSGNPLGFPLEPVAVP